jgi:hypothetical protein
MVELIHKEVTSQIVAAAYEVSNQLGAHKAQVINYLKATGLEVGSLISYLVSASL